MMLGKHIDLQRTKLYYIEKRSSIYHAKQTYHRTPRMHEQTDPTILNYSIYIAPIGIQLTSLQTEIQESVMHVDNAIGAYIN